MNGIDALTASASTSNSISMAVAKKSLDAARQQGDAAVKMIQSAAKVADELPTSNQSPNGVDAYA